MKGEQIMSLLGHNRKTDKSKMDTKTLTLLPVLHGACPNAVECKPVCLRGSGQGAMPAVDKARERKADWRHEDLSEFMTQLVKELKAFDRKMCKENKIGGVRLNTLTDFEYRDLVDMESYKHIIFYDYTKDQARMQDWIDGKCPANYHLTFSWQPANDAFAMRVIKAGYLVARVLFMNGKRDDVMPSTLEGYPVISGDDSDERPSDPRVSGWLGLIAKGSAGGRAEHCKEIKNGLRNGFITATNFDAIKDPALRMAQEGKLLCRQLDRAFWDERSAA